MYGVRRLLSLWRRPAERRKLLRFAGVSVVATLTTSAALALLIDVFGLSNLPATFVAAMLGALPSFELSRRWVWAGSDRARVGRQAAIFWVLAVVRMVVALAAVKGVSLLTGALPRGERTLVVEAATFGAYGVLWLVQFGLLDRLLFKMRPASLEGTEATA